MKDYIPIITSEMFTEPYTEADLEEINAEIDVISDYYLNLKELRRKIEDEMN